VVAIVAAAKEPPLRTGLIDRFLVAVEQQGIDAWVVINKIDRASEQETRPRVAVYETIGYPVLFTSVVTGQGVAELKERLRAKTVLLVGHSGVGKSSLMNALLPESA